MIATTFRLCSCLVGVGEFSYLGEMNTEIRGGLAVVCVALIATVIAIATRGGNEDGTLVGAAATLIALVLGVFGLGVIAVGLVRRP